MVEMDVLDRNDMQSEKWGTNPPVYQVGYPCCGNYILYAFTTVFESHLGHPVNYPQIRI